MKRLSRTLFFEMSERCNNSACFSVEIEGASDICVTFVVYACGKSMLGVRTHGAVKSYAQISLQTLAE